MNLCFLWQVIPRAATVRMLANDMQVVAPSYFQSPLGDQYHRNICELNKLRYVPANVTIYATAQRYENKLVHCVDQRSFRNPLTILLRALTYVQVSERVCESSVIDFVFVLPSSTAPELRLL